MNIMIMTFMFIRSAAIICLISYFIKSFFIRNSNTWNSYLSHRIIGRQLSANIKLKNNKIKTSFVSPEGP